MDYFLSVVLPTILSYWWTIGFALAAVCGYLIARHDGYVTWGECVWLLVLANIWPVLLIVAVIVGCIWLDEAGVFRKHAFRFLSPEEKKERAERRRLEAKVKDENRRRDRARKKVVKLAERVAAGGFVSGSDVRG